MRVECSCGKKLRVDDKLAGKRIKCPGCGTVLKAEEPPAPPEPEEVQDDAGVETEEVDASKKRRKDTKNLDDEERPRRKSKKHVDDDEEEEEEEEEEKPRKKRKKKRQMSLSPALLAAIGGGALLLIAGVVIGVVFLTRTDKPAGPTTGTPAPPPTGANKDPGNRPWLSDLPERDVRLAAGTLGKNGQCGFIPDGIRVDGVKFEHALGAHSESSVTYDLGGRYKTFHTTAAINDTGGVLDYYPVFFRVIADGALIWESRPLHKKADKQECLLNIEGVKQLTLAVVNGRVRTYGVKQYTVGGIPQSGQFIVLGNAESRTMGGAHTVWLDPYVDVAAAATGTPAPLVTAAQMKARAEFLETLDKGKCNWRQDDNGRVTTVIAWEAAMLPKITPSKDVEDLELYSDEFTDATVADLVTSMPQLTRLKLMSARITDRSMKSVASLSKLKEVSLQFTGVTDAGMADLQRLADLEAIRVAGNLISADGLGRLKALPKLHVVDIANNFAFDANALDALATALPNLTELHFFGLPFGDAGLGKLKRFTRLEKLSLRSTPGFTEAGMQHFAGLNNLKELTCHSVRISDGALSQISTKLERLALDNTLVTDAGMTHLKRATGLKYLRLVQSKVTDTGLGELAELRQLEELVLNLSPITDAAVPTLLRFKSLKLLGTNQTRITVQGVQKLQQGLPYCMVVY